jgi:uncharacterized membrane protein required for colicin V production
MNWLDMVFSIFFIVNAVQGFSRGFILSAFKTAGVIVALYVGIFYRETVVDFLKTYLPIETAIAAVFKVPQHSETGADIIKVLGLSTVIDMALGGLGFLLVFFMVNLAFLIPAYFVHGLVKLVALTPLNRGLGMLFGIARTALVIALVSSALSPFLMAWPGGWWERSFSTSYILFHLRFLDIITPLVVKLI